MARHRLTLISMTLAVVVGACGGEPDADSTTEPVATSTSTSVAPTTSTAPSEIDGLEYPVSDEWVVETVARDIAAGTGGLAVDEQGVIYMGDFGYTANPGSGIFRITPDGEADVFADAEGMSQLTTTRIGPDGSLYQSSYGSNTVFRVDKDGNADVVTDHPRPNRDRGSRGRNPGGCLVEPGHHSPGPP